MELIGRISNASAIGARVIITAGGGEQMREISGGSGYLAQNSLIAHFGLRYESNWPYVLSIEVRWPSGVVQILELVPADQRIVIDEGGVVEAPIAQAATLASGIQLYQNAPNPFAGTTTIPFELPVARAVTLAVYDVTGRRVRVLEPGDGPKAAGRHMVRWEGRDDRGQKVAAGVYFYRLDAGGVPEKRRMTLLR